jgi:hypothetical protein
MPLKAVPTLVPDDRGLAHGAIYEAGYLPPQITVYQDQRCTAFGWQNDFVPSSLVHQQGGVLDPSQDHRFSLECVIRVKSTFTNICCADVLPSELRPHGTSAQHSPGLSVASCSNGETKLGYPSRRTYYSPTPPPPPFQGT